MADHQVVIRQHRTVVTEGLVDWGTWNVFLFRWPQKLFYCHLTVKNTLGRSSEQLRAHNAHTESEFDSSIHIRCLTASCNSKFQGETRPCDLFQALGIHTYSQGHTHKIKIKRLSWTAKQSLLLLEIWGIWLKVTFQILVIKHSKIWLSDKT